MGEPSLDDRQIAAQGLAVVREIIDRGDVDVLILDEVNVALGLRLLDLADVLELVQSKPAGLELVLTGRGAPRELLDAADLVTEMVKVKHYYDRRVPARDGIEA